MSDVTGLTTWGYDTAGRLSSVGDWLGRAVGFSYDADGRRTGVTRPNGVTTTNSYDAGARLTSITHATPGGATLRHFTYTLDAAGNRTAVATEGGTESYTLDALSRVTSVSYPDGTSAGYTYDAGGNRLTKTAAGVTTTYTYDDADQLLSDGTSSSSYDASGNLLTAGSSAFTWDFANRLATASVGGTASSYAYDGDSTRVAKTVAGVTVPYTWDREASLPLLAGDGANSFLSDTDAMLGHLDGGNAPSYYLGDGIGSVRGLSDLTGTLTGSADYDVFGAARVSSGSVELFQFAGQQSDSADGLIPNGPGQPGLQPLPLAGCRHWDGIVSRRGDRSGRRPADGLLCKHGSRSARTEPEVVEMTPTLRRRHLRRSTNSFLSPIEWGTRQKRILGLGSVARKRPGRPHIECRPGVAAATHRAPGQ